MSGGKRSGEITPLSLDGIQAFVIEAPALLLPDTLTPSERSVVELLLQGATNAQIADARKSRARTVANQVGSIYRKLGVNSRAELLARLLRAHG